MADVTTTAAQPDSGYDSLRKLVFFGISVAQAYEAAKGADSFAKKLAAYFQVVDEAAALFTVDYSGLKDEYKKLNQAQRDRLRQDVQNTYKFQDSSLDGKMELSIDRVIDGICAVRDLVDTWAS